MNFYRNEKGHNHSPKLEQNAAQYFAILLLKPTGRVKKILWRHIVNRHIQEPKDVHFCPMLALVTPLTMLTELFS